MSERKIKNEYFILRIEINGKYFLVNSTIWNETDECLRIDKIHRWNDSKKYVSESNANKAAGRIEELYGIKPTIVTIRANIYDSDGVVIERN